MNNNDNLNKLNNFISKIDIDKEKFFNFIKKNYKKIIIITILIIILYIFFFIYYNRVNRYINYAETLYNKLLQSNNLADNNEYMKGNYRVCDFYVASSYKSYLPCNYYYDYASSKSIESILKSGARLIDLDVMNKGFSSCTTPVIANGDEIGNWHYTTNFTFEEGIETIKKYAFSRFIKNNKDPLYININFKTWYNKDTINRCAMIIKKHLSNKFIDQKYMYQGRFTNTNICTSSIKDIINKIVIMTTSDVHNTDMDEIVNLCSLKTGTLRLKTYEQIKESYDAKEISEYNKKNLTLVFPDYNNRIKKNNNFFTSYYLGCQFILMNYSKPDQWMLEYIEQFKHCSFILKPYKLRYKPILIKPPLEQTSKVSFAPRKASSPFYNITY